MYEIHAKNAGAYLRQTGRVPDGAGITVRELQGGVSNVVLRVDADGQDPVVLKQSRERLRTQAEWVSRLDRIWTEKAALEALAGVLPAGTVPAVLYDDPENYLFAMSAAPDDATVWKEELLAGSIQPAVARAAGDTLGSIHAATVGHPALEGRLADTSLFEGLRLDPYYRTVARIHRALRLRLENLIAAMEAARPVALVLGDFSPKNVLVHRRGLTLVDFETAHAGDPMFDVGFFLSHVILKAFHAGPNRSRQLVDLGNDFLTAYLRARLRRGIEASPEDVGRASRHAAACLLARIDGKSPVDYLDQLDPAAVRRCAHAALWSHVSSWEALVDLFKHESNA